jgi:N-acetylglucosaminyldiphosphoundecaprenol N-acetyl-beta-D-mannosaminyltransferase
MPCWNRRSVAVLGVPFDNVTIEEAVNLIEEKIDERGFHQVAPANLDFVIHAINDKTLQDLICSCDLIVSDGMPVVWASHLMGARLKERVSGIDLIPRIAELSARRGYGMYLLGASETSSRKAAEHLQQRFPALHIVGRHCPPVASLGEMDHEDILERIERARPDILLVAMGHPKQEQWLAMHRERLNVPLCMGVGASLDFLAGTVSRAPVWMQTAGVEWLYRAGQEPRRLVRRYFNDACGLMRHLPPQMAANAVQPHRTVNSAVQTHWVGSASVISVNGDLNDLLLSEFEDHVRRAQEESRQIVLDLAETGYVGPESVGFLVHLTTVMRRFRRRVWIAGAPPHVLRVFRKARVIHRFSSASNVSDAVYRVTKEEGRLPAALIAFDSLSPSVSDIRVEAEMLKDLCRRIVAVSQRGRQNVGGLRARTTVMR